MARESLVATARFRAAYRRLTDTEQPQLAAELVAASHCWVHVLQRRSGQAW